jgi:hypothetical protein
MAYTRALNAATQFGDPLVLAVTGNILSAETNVPVKVPWDNVDLTYAYTVVTVITTTGDCTVDLEIDAAGGTQIGTATIAYSGCAVGDVDELTLSAPASRKNLLSSNIINVEIDGGANAGQFVLYLYFEPSEYA